MYTTEPLSSTGYIALIFVYVILIAITVIIFSVTSVKKKTTLAVISVATALFTVALFRQFEYDNRFINKPVVATLMDITASDMERVRVSKHRYEMQQMLYVFYKTPEGAVAFKRKPGAVYPERAILYWNPVEKGIP